MRSLGEVSLGDKSEGKRVHKEGWRSARTDAGAQKMVLEKMRDLKEQGYTREQAENEMYVWMIENKIEDF
jgi:hypothetical protein